jgi:hypothetical protein
MVQDRSKRAAGLISGVAASIIAKQIIVFSLSGKAYHEAWTGKGALKPLGERPRFQARVLPLTLHPRMVDANGFGPALQGFS